MVRAGGGGGGRICCRAVCTSMQVADSALSEASMDVHTTGEGGGGGGGGAKNQQQRRIAQRLR